MSCTVHEPTTNPIESTFAPHLVARASAAFGNRRLVEQSDHQHAAAPATAA
jgi:hypothetical protein